MSQFDRQFCASCKNYTFHASTDGLNWACVHHNQKAMDMAIRAEAVREKIRMFPDWYNYRSRN